MASASANWVKSITQTWFDELGPDDWFKGSETVDDMLRQRFGGELTQQKGRSAQSFLDDADTARAAILLFDQIPRNIHRGTPLAFATDAIARELAKAVIAKNWDAGLPDEERQFVAMPLMHSEALSDQTASLAYFTKHLPDNVPFAQSHYDAIARFGRFPHRNEVLGRETTAAEAEAIADGMKW